MSYSRSLLRSEQVGIELRELLKETVASTLLENKIPLAISDKLARQVADNIEMSSFYSIIEQDIQMDYLPKQRILDRVIVHIFEELYRTVNEPFLEQRSYNEKGFFHIVPRGDCLDLFLQLVKEYCMGDSEVDNHTKQIEVIIQFYQNGDNIDWEQVYTNQQFKVYSEKLLQLILSRLHKSKKPIVVLENKIPLKYQPYRINLFLGKVCSLWEKQLNPPI